ncbi:ABC transporter permease [uncultured Alsobacter sp.]|uniref:ABC transporter permease n=1 Tax=uncultured Alsobacter sp. TaxID=1748258 RepID=UPI0025DA36DC|nr:ABC transporter permease [uncultured Alsobacter sp.]
MAGRILSIVLTLLGLLLLTFTMGRLLPADPVLAITGAEVNKATYDRVYQELGLDRPVWEQFLTYLGKVLRGDLGVSATTGHSVLTDLAHVFPATLELAMVAVVTGVLIGVPLGIVAAVNRGKPIDHVARIIGLAGHSVPIFWLGLMALLLFYAKLHWVDASGRLSVFYEGMMEPVTGLLLLDTAMARDWDMFRDVVSHIALPGLLLGYYSVAYISRMTRSFVLEQLNQEYVVAARAKGLSTFQIVWRHVFKNIRVQLLTIVALTLGGLLDGAVLIETVFGWPGLGQYLTRGLTMNDMNVVMGAVLLTGTLFVTINLITDRLYKVLDARTR